MTSRRLRTPLLVAVSLLPAAASAVSWNARVGTEYTQQDVWSADAGHETYPHLDVNLALDASGLAQVPGGLSWNGAVDYRTVRAEVGGPATKRDALSYRLQSTLFTDPNAPFSVSANASRSDDEQWTSGVTGTDTLDTTVWRVDARYGALLMPSLAASYTAVESERVGPLYGVAHTARQTVNAMAGHGDSAFSYTARYRGNLSEGTFASENYDDHRVEFVARAALTPTSDLHLSDTYYLRLPRTESELNARQEVNAFAANLRGDVTTGAVHRASYAYTHALQTAPGRDDVESAKQNLAYGLNRTLPSRAWIVRADATVSYADERLGADRRKSTGETVTTVAVWRRFRDGQTTELRGGPSFALLQPAEGGSRIGYGAQAGASLHRTDGLFAWGATYDVRHEANLFGAEGWSLSQDLSLDANGPFGPGAARAQVAASALRRQAALFGAAASRTLSAAAGYRYGRYDLQLQASVTSAISAELVGGLASDGLLLPAPYDTHTVALSSLLSASLTRYLVAGTQLRYDVTDIPDRPSRTDAAARAFLELRYASLSFSLEDRYAVSEIPGGSFRANQVMVRAYRAFGSGW
jgi:hypothetical protein